MDVSDNQLGSLPLELQQMTGLRLLVLSGNQRLLAFPPSAAKKTGTKVEVHSQSLGESSTTWLTAWEWQFKGPLVVPKEVARQRAPDILRYLEDVDKLGLTVDLRSHWVCMGVVELSALERRAAPWLMSASVRCVQVPDDSAAACNLCNAPFTTFFRRHHCRLCGKLACKKCTPHELNLAIFHAKEPVRVCTEVRGACGSVVCSAAISDVRVVDPPR
jgi:hypothetical protein